MCKFSFLTNVNQFDVVTSSADNAEYIGRKFTLNSTLDSSGTSLPNFPLRTVSLVSDMHEAPSLVSAIICHLDPHKACESDCIPVIFIKK